MEAGNSTFSNGLHPHLYKIFSFETVCMQVQINYNKVSKITFTNVASLPDLKTIRYCVTHLLSNFSNLIVPCFVIVKH
mgnify:CR=1 FL=1